MNASTFHKQTDRGAEVQGSNHQSQKETGMAIHRNNSEKQTQTMQNSSTTANSLQNEKPAAQCEGTETLKNENREILSDLGQINVKNEERKSELFQQIFHSSSTEVKPPCNNIPITVDRLGYQNDSRVNDPTLNSVPDSFSNPQIMNENAGEQPVEVAVLQESNYQPEKQETVTRDKEKRTFQGRDQNSTGISTFRNNSENQNPTTSREKTSDREGNDIWTSDAPSTSREEGYENEQRPTRQSNEDLSSSVQQDDSNGREFITQGNIPPTSDNNYKLLLLSLGQSLLSSDVVKLKDWASQNFSIENAQNATDVLLQLHKKGIINASNLSPLRDFFESIVRIDLVHIIDEFLLGDYSLLRQIPSRRRTRTTQQDLPTVLPNATNSVQSSRPSSVDENQAQNSGNATTSRVLRTPGNVYTL